MLLSMTGYGRATNNWEDKTILVEVRSLNSKYTDLRLRCSQNLREKEAQLRKMVTDFAHRGKLEMSIDITSHLGDDQFGLNVPLFKKYFSALSELSTEFDYEDKTLMSAILRLPNVAASSDGEMSKEEWKAITDTISAALEKFQAFREQEGAATANDLTERVNTISGLLEQVSPHEQDRVEAIRDRLYRSLDDKMGKDRIDESRYEQEVLFYLEKMDINEEKMRLAQHCEYFLEVLNNKTQAKGRKLSFISQEIGREINTLGAKAYSSNIQRLVVGMKDELEKIKEQTANIV
ncbi:YicC/YloC family endoribonuclease [Lewinella cohaerens]|uniref:YicC/YloC family endoribonuclease n=1 Tax=Lewinella cohaerens TaxID=70995 RepID=UPI001FDF9977|nr:YicC/YloC family endoribonuclease [Lewinella cohaerens]